MSRLILIGGIVCLIFMQMTSPLHADQTYIRHREKLLTDIRRDKYQAQTTAALKQIHEQATRDAENQMVSFDNLCYAKGFLLWEKGDLKSAAREWFKFLEYKRIHHEEKIDPRTSEVRLIYEQSISLMNAMPAVSRRTKSESLPTDSARSRAKRSGVRRKNQAASVDVTAKKTNTHRRSVYLIRKARLAKTSGQLGYAQKLYRMAQDFDPESEQAKTELAELEKEMQ